ncbi:protein of unknown function (DUF3328) domain containing protein [Rhypophila sp. PSN 637]
MSKILHLFNPKRSGSSSINTGKYAPVFSSENDGSEASLSPSRPAKRPTICSQLVSYSLYFLATVIVFSAGLFIGQSHPGTTTCVKKLSMYSPLNDAVEYHDYNFDNKFAHKTEFRGPPTPELEETWTRLWQMGEIRIPEDKIPILNEGRPHKEFKKFPDGGYAAGVMMFHQLHCINYIRQYTWGMDYYDRHNMSRPLKSTAVGQRMHVDHCIEELRKTIMCYGDTTPMLVEILPDAPIGKKSDFDARHRCRNFDKLHGWMEEHVVNKW